MDLIEIYNKILKEDQKDTIKISYYIIDYCLQNNIELTNLKLNKLCYFANIYFMLNNNGEPLFKDEEFLAWRHGPVMQSIYNKFCIGIVCQTKENIKVIKEELPKEKKASIDYILKNYAKEDVWSLVKKTHIKNGPWYQIYTKYKNNDGICVKNIPNKLIYNLYSNGIDYV